MGALEEFLNEGLERVILSSPADGEEIRKVRIRPILLRGELVFQAEEQRGTQAFHKNMNREETAAYVAGLLAGSLKQMELSAAGGTVHALVSKKGKMTVKIRRKMAVPAAGLPAPASHNRRKRYVLEEGKPVPFLVDLGVMTGDGQVVRSRYDKFRQINRFLEFIEDILPRLDRERENVIIDFGCGKSYLTFAMYYYLKELKGYSIRVIGLDLKKDVIARCNLLAERYGFDRLRFYHGDIASYEGVDQVDMVVTLHACDTATDYALSKAVKWGARVILSVPCCQHELNGQMENELLAPPVLLWNHKGEDGGPVHRRHPRGASGIPGLPHPAAGVHRHGAHAQEYPDPRREAGREEGQPPAAGGDSHVSPRRFNPLPPALRGRGGDGPTGSRAEKVRKCLTFSPCVATIIHRFRVLTRAIHQRL